MMDVTDVIDDGELTEHVIRKIVESSFKDCLTYPGLLLHEKMTVLRNFVLQNEKGIINPDLPCTDVVKIPLNCYSGTSLMNMESPFSAEWCAVIGRDLDSYAQINFKWEPHENYLLIIEEFIELCNQPNATNNVAIDFINDFMLKLKSGVQKISGVDFGDTEKSVSTGDMTTLYSSSSVASTCSNQELKNAEFTGKEKEAPVYVRYADLLTLKKDFDAYKNNLKQNKLGSGYVFTRSSSDEKNEFKENSTCANKNSKRRVVDMNYDSGSSDGEIKRKKIITAETGDVPRYSIQCCSCKRTFNSYLGLFSHLRLIHHVGVKSNSKRKCKLCQSLINEDLMMLHIELVHTVSSPSVELYGVNVGFKDFSGETHKYVEIFPISFTDATKN